MTVLRAVRGRGGVARAGELHAVGIGPGLIRTATALGEVVRVRKGWYADPGLPADALRAVRVGGALTCVSAARALGLWTPEDDGALHVAVPSTAARLRHPDRHRVRLADVDAPVVVHWTDTTSRGIVTLDEALAAAAACQGAETAFVLLESALFQRRVLATGLSQLPGEVRRLCRHAGDRSESGCESLVKLMLLRLGLPFRQQVSVSGVGRVDFVVGRRLIIEADSRGFHADAYRDRKRDAAASSVGYRSLRFLYAQIVHETAEVEAAILGAIARGDHL